MERYAFVSRHGSCSYVAVTHEASGENLPRLIDGNPVSWVRIRADQDEAFCLIANEDLARDLNQVWIHITETRTKRLHHQF